MIAASVSVTSNVGLEQSATGLSARRSAPKLSIALWYWRAGQGSNGSGNQGPRRCVWCGLLPSCYSLRRN